MSGINKPGSKEAKFRGRQKLSATELNRVVEATVKGIKGSGGIGQRTSLNQVVLFIKDKNKGIGSRGEDCEDCDCQDALDFEECWSLGWFQDLTGGGSIGGTFELSAGWRLVTDIGHNPVTGCDQLRTIIPGNCGDFIWELTLAGSAPVFVTEYPWNGVDPISIHTPWGDDIAKPPGTIITDCGNGSVDVFSMNPPTPGDDCNEVTGDPGPCTIGDPRTQCDVCV